MISTGLLGGTFDPIHNGHIALAENALKQCDLHEVWFMPAPQPPHKTDKFVSDFQYRYEMTEIGIRGHESFIITDFEQKLEGKSYSARTLAELKKAFPERVFSFIIGADSLFDIEKWYHPEEVMRLTTLIVAVREYDSPISVRERREELISKYNADIILLDAPHIDISSSDIRIKVASGIDIGELVPDGVAEYIREHGLYGKN